MRLLMLLVVALLPLSANAETFQLKGIAIGSSADDFLKLHPYLPAEGPHPEAGGICDAERTGKHSCRYKGFDRAAPFTVGGAIGDLDLTYQDNRLVEISVLFSDPDAKFPKVYEALKTKYGKPRRTKFSIVGTAIGTRYKNAEVTWTLPDVVIILEKYTDDINTSSLYVVGKTYMATQSAKDKKAARRDLNDL